MADNRDTITVAMRLRGAVKFAAEVRAARKEIEKLGKSGKKAGQEGDGAGKAFGLLGTTLRVTALGAVLASQGVGAAAISVVAFGAALAPVVGLVGALPAGLLLAAQAFGVVSLAMAGVKAAVGPLDGAINPDKFAALTRPAQDFVLALDAMKGGVRNFQRSVQVGLFPGLTAGLIAARPALAALKGPLTGTAQIIGAFARNLGQLVGSAGMLADLRSQASFNNIQFRRLSATGLHLVGIFRNLTVGSRGLVSWIVRGVASFAAWADHATAAGRASGGLQRGFHTVQVTTQRIVLTLWRFGVALFNIGRIGKREIGDGILVHLLRGATALERWTSSEAGIRKIGAAFAWAKRVLAGVADFMSRAAQGTGPQLVALLRNVLNVLNPIIASGGGVAVLGLYARAINDVARAIGWFERNVPGATYVLSAFFAAMLLNKVTGIGAVASSMWTLTRAIAGTTVVTRVAATAFWALNAALVANPIGAVIVGVLAAGAAFYLLYTKVTWFHNAVGDVWAFIKDHWADLLPILLAPLAPVLAVVSQIVAGFRTVKGLFGGALGIAGKALGAINPFAAGGVVNSPLQMVGERGPELAALPIGTRMFSAPETRQMLRAPTMPRLSAPAAAPRGRGGPSIVRNYITVEIDKYVLTKVINDVIADEHAAG